MTRKSAIEKLLEAHAAWVKLCGAEDDPSAEESAEEVQSKVREIERSAPRGCEEIRAAAVLLGETAARMVAAHAAVNKIMGGLDDDELRHAQAHYERIAR